MCPSADASECFGWRVLPSTVVEGSGREVGGNGIPWDGHWQVSLRPSTQAACFSLGVQMRCRWTKASADGSGDHPRAPPDATGSR